MNQELQYLRAEMNQRISFFYEHSQKTTHIILLIWGGILVIFGAPHILDDMMLYFICGTIFFISNLILCFSVQKIHDNLNQIFKIAAYINVFYERIPSKIIEVSQNFSWELVTFEIQANEAASKIKDRKLLYKINGEYTTLVVISIFGILFFTVMLFQSLFQSNEFKGNEIFQFSFCVIWFLSSFYLLFEVNKYTSLKGIADIKIKHLKNFLQYSIDIKYYTEEEIKERFGKFLEKLEKVFDTKFSVSTSSHKEKLT
ncbi:MAG: hypothetical protein FWH22_02960 [Fibromonadales bacterium]|nr:hypothetical protein [Fibromonadales bacterium]